MPQMNGRIPVDAIMEMLEIDKLPAACRYKPHQEIELDCISVDQDEIDAEATEQEPEYIDPALNDLGEGLAALRSGDIALARILLDRAFDAHGDDVRGAVETALRPERAKVAA